jgi:hypothetical protein
MNSDSKPMLLADHADVRNPIQCTPQDLDSEAYALTRLPTDQELAEIADDIDHINASNMTDENRVLAIGNRILRMFSDTRKAL